MPSKIYKKFGTDFVTFLRKEGNNYKLLSREIRMLYRDDDWNLYIRNYKSSKRFVRVKYSKNKKIGLYVVR